MIKVKLSDIVEEIEFNSDMGISVLNLKTGHIVHVPDELMVDSDNNESEELMIEHQSDYLNNPVDYIELPSQRDANEYKMMERFILNLEDETQQQ